MISVPDKRLQRGTFTAGRRAVRADRVWANRRRHDEGLGIVDDERLECSVPDFPRWPPSPSTRFSTFTPPCVSCGTVLVNQCRRVSMNSRSCRPVRSSRQPSPRASGSKRLTRLRFVHSVVRSHWMLANAVLEVDRARLAIEPETPPVPQLEGEDVGRGADFQHHGVRPAAMHRAGRNEKMIVLLGREFVRVAFRPERARRLLCASSRSRRSAAGSMPSCKPR